MKGMRAWASLKLVVERCDDQLAPDAPGLEGLR